MILEAILFSFIVTAYAMQPQDDLSDILLQIGYDNLDIEGKDNFILILGDVDGGDNELSYVLREVSTKPRRGNGILFPSVKLDDNTESLIIDLPGFYDNRNSYTDLTSGFYNKIVFDYAKRVKIVILTKEASVQAGNEVFGMFLEKLVQIVGGNYVALVDSISVVITKEGNSTTDEELLTNFISRVTYNHFMRSEKAGEENYNRQRFLLSSMLKQKLIAVFKRSTSRSPWNQLEMEENHRQLRRLIFEKVKFSSPFAEKCHTVVKTATIVSHVKSILDDSTITLIANMIVKSMLENELNADFSDRPLAAGIDLDDFYEFYQMFSNIPHEEFLDFIKKSAYKLWYDLKFEIKKLEFVRSALTGDTSELESRVLRDLRSWIMKKLDKLENMILYYVHLKNQNSTITEESTTPYSE